MPPGDSPLKRSEAPNRGWQLICLGHGACHCQGTDDGRSSTPLTPLRDRLAQSGQRGANALAGQWDLREGEAAGGWRRLCFSSFSTSWG